MNAAIAITAVIAFIALFILWAWMILDCLENERGDGKVMWLIIIFFSFWLGALVYFGARRAPRIREQGY